MAGHSQFANIKHKKEAQDKKRGKIFHRILKEIAVGAKIGGPNPETNPALRLQIEKAKQFNMPKDTIERALAKAAGKGNSENYEEVTFEGYGPNGTAYVVKVLTDNHKRSVSNVKSYFTKVGGSIGVKGSVAYLFVEKGVILVKNTIDEEKVMEVALSNNATDFNTEDGMYLINCEPNDFMKLLDALKKLGYNEFEISEISREPNEYIELDGEALAKNNRLIDLLEDDDDVQEVYHNIALN